jgi:hypothetical protein
MYLEPSSLNYSAAKLGKEWAATLRDGTLDLGRVQAECDHRTIRFWYPSIVYFSSNSIQVFYQ